jgi:hypothetical protein
MTLPTGTISFLDIQNEFGGANPIYLNEYYAGAVTGYVPYTTYNVHQLAVPRSGEISLYDFQGASQKDAAGSQTFYASGTFVGKYGYTGVTLEWYDNDGYHAVSYATTSGTSYDVTIGGAGAASSFGAQGTNAFNKSVFNVWLRVDAVSYPRATIYNNLSAAYNFQVGTQMPVIDYYAAFDYNGSRYNNWNVATAGYPEGYDKYYNYYPAEPAHGSITDYFRDQFGMTFTNDYEAGHGPLRHSVGITTFPAAVAYGGSVYLSYNSSFNYNESVDIDVWNPATGDLRMHFRDENGGEYNMQAVVNYTQPVWIKASWG